MKKLLFAAAIASSVGVLVVPSFLGVAPAQAKQSSNKGGAVRGLDRANAVAGTHGANGRAKAAAAKTAPKTGDDDDTD
jgi:hypothetical protein